MWSIDLLILVDDLVGAYYASVLQVFGLALVLRHGAHLVDAWVAHIDRMKFARGEQETSFARRRSTQQHGFPFSNAHIPCILCILLFGNDGSSMRPRISSTDALPCKISTSRALDKWKHYADGVYRHKKVVDLCWRTPTNNGSNICNNQGMDKRVECFE